MLYITHDPNELGRLRVIRCLNIALGLCLLANHFQLAKNMKGAWRLWIRAGFDHALYETCVESLYGDDEGGECWYGDAGGEV